MWKVERVGKGGGEMKQKAPQNSHGLVLQLNLNVSGLRLNLVFGVPGYFRAPQHPWRGFVTEARLPGRRTDREDALCSEVGTVKLLKSFPVCAVSLCNGSSGSHQAEDAVYSYTRLFASCVCF